jgi:hypothetical protein
MLNYERHNSDEDIFIPRKFVMERTGHRDIRSLQKYERPDIKTKMKYQNIWIVALAGAALKKTAV